MESAKSGYESMLKTSLNYLNMSDLDKNSEEYTNTYDEIVNGYLNKINEIEQRVMGFQFDTISNAFSKDYGNILPNFEGDLGTRLQTAITGAFSEGYSVKEWGNKQWMDLLGLDGLDNSGEFMAVLQPIAQMMSKGFVDSSGLLDKDKAAVALNMSAGRLQDWIDDNPLHWQAFIEGKLTSPFGNQITSLEMSTDPKSTDYIYNSDPYLGDSMIVPQNWDWEKKEQKKQEYMPWDKRFQSFGDNNNDKSTNNPFNNPFMDYLEKKADGDIITSPTKILAGEAGSEAIIPLSAGKRNRGLSLWERAGEMLGIRPYADGGIIKSTSATIPSSTGASGYVNVPVTIENVTFDVDIDADNSTSIENIVQIMKANIENLTDEIAYKIAMSLQQVFANMPVEAEGV
jgi:hypothetical protein